MKSKKLEIEWNRLLYPILTIVLASIVAISFFSATAFFTRNFNKAFDADEPGIDQNTNIDMDQLEVVAKKLHVTIEKPTPVVESAQTTRDLQDTTKSELQIEILNASGIKGAANALKVSLEEQGYSVKKTGDAPISDITFIRTKHSVTEDHNQLNKTLVTILEKKYAFREELLPEDANFDVIIILGHEFSYSTPAN